MGEERDLPSLGSRFRERLAADRSRADSPTEDGQYGQGLRREWGKESACLVWGPSWPRPAPPPSLPQTKLGLTGGGHRARLASNRPEPPGLRGSGADPGAPWGWLGWGGEASPLSGPGESNHVASKDAGGQAEQPGKSVAPGRWLADPGPLPPPPLPSVKPLAK